MKTPATLLRSSITGLGILAAVAAASCSAHDPKYDPKFAHLGPMPPTTTLEHLSGQNCPRPDAQRTLSLSGPDGQVFGLTYLGGCGWRLLADPQADGQGTSALRNVAAAQADASTAIPVEPLAVFIDGPTGYTFVWSR